MVLTATIGAGLRMTVNFRRFLHALLHRRSLQRYLLTHTPPYCQLRYPSQSLSSLLSVALADAPLPLPPP
eukprot:1893746-Prymnesium_polylepis.1